MTCPQVLFSGIAGSGSSDIVEHMFESSSAVDPADLFPALAAAIRAVPVRPDRGDPSAVPVTAETRALLGLRRELEARLLSRLAAVDAQGLAAADGFPSTGSWLRGFGNLDAGQAVSLVKAARVTEALPLLAEVLAAGKIGVEHLQAVAGGAARV
ncbi:MAG: hypothetical protein QOJ11_547, partial [Frankiales bacterium]|nr:hypothetical protein [Frankiales bacterium]